MPNEPKRELAPIGTVTESEVDCVVCLTCLCVVHMGMCDFDCPFDGIDERASESTVRRVYKRVDTLIRSEVITDAR